MTQNPITSWRDKGITEIVIHNPPVNALSHPVREGLVDAIQKAEKDRFTKGILLRAEGKTFPVGADIREFGKKSSPPSLPELCNRIEDARKPIVAFLHGTVLGGGLELALSADLRFAHPDTEFGFPEINLGLIPGAGGTQRTPRICGAKASLELMLTGNRYSADHMLELELIDLILERSQLKHELDRLKRAVAAGRQFTPTRNRTDGLHDSSEYKQEIEDCRSELSKRTHCLKAHRSIVDCVAAARSHVFSQGLALERKHFLDCLDSKESAALRHAFFAERKSPKAEWLIDARPRETNSVAVVGGGLMGSGITVALLSAGVSVSLIEVERLRLSSAIEKVRNTIGKLVRKGTIALDEAERRLSRLSGQTDFSDVGNVEFVVEAVSEDFATKASVYAELNGKLKPGTAIATNTSYLDIDELAEESGREEDFVGMHFFAPAHVMKLVEVVRGRKTSIDAVATAVALARRAKKVVVHSGVCEGFIGNRILIACREAADLMLLDGASPYEVDAAMLKFGFRLGTYATQDMSGLDISWSRRKRALPDRDPELRYNPLGDRLCEAGRFGQKSGRGYYVHGQDRERQEDPDVLAMLDDIRSGAGVKPRHSFSSEQIQSRMLAAMVNEGARILEEGIACRPSDVDVVKMLGYGFPRWRGGPFFHADVVGIDSILQTIEEASYDDPLFWKASPLLEKMARERKRFSEWSPEN